MSGSSSSPSQSHAVREPAWTVRQREVLDLLVRGRTNPEIAQALGISLDGAKWHVSEVITKLGVDSRDEAAEYWRAHTGLRPRFTRIFHALIASTWLKVGVAGAVVAGASVAVVIVIMAVNGSGTSPAGTLPTPTTVAALSGCPSDQSCAVAEGLTGVLNSGAYDTLFAHWPTKSFLCPGGPPVLGAPYPLCDGAATGENRQGYQMANSVTAFELSPNQMAERLRPDTSSSANAWTLRTIGCPPGPGAIASCTSRALVVVVATYASGRQQYYIFDLMLATGTWVVDGLTAGPLFQPAVDAAVLDGGTVSADSHSSIPAGTTFSRVY